jgi:enamine deaminase RidA (YjgF/YER057c/UK114 family)
MDVYEKLKSLNLRLPEAPKKGGVYTPAKLLDNGLLYVSGCGPNLDEVSAGKLGAEFSIEEGMVFARNCMLNILAVVEAKIGDLNRVVNCIKLLVLVASADDFYSQPQVANGASSLLVELYGEEAGCPARSAIGVNVLPGNIPVAIAAIFSVNSAE